MTKVTYREIPEYIENGKKQIKIPNSKIEALHNGTIGGVIIGTEGFEVLEIPDYTNEEITYTVMDDKIYESKNAVTTVEVEKKEYTGITYDEAKEIAKQNGTSILKEISEENIKIEPDKLSLEEKEKWIKYFLAQKPKNFDAQLFQMKYLKELDPDNYQSQYDEMLTSKTKDKSNISTPAEESKETEEKNKQNEMITLYTVVRKSDGVVILNTTNKEEWNNLLKELKMTLKDYYHSEKRMPLEKFIAMQSDEKKEKTTKVEKPKTSAVTNLERLTATELSEKIYHPETLEKIQKTNDPQIDPKKLFVGAKLTREEEGKIIEEYCKTIKLEPKNKEDQEQYIHEIFKSVEEFAVDNNINVDNYRILYQATLEPIILKETENNISKSKYENWIDVSNNPSIIGIETKEEYYQRCFPESKQR